MVVLRRISGGNIAISTADLRNVKSRSFSTDQDGMEQNSISSLVKNDHEGHGDEGKTAAKETSILVLFEKTLLPSTAVYMLIWFSLSFGSYGISTWISVLFEDVGVGNVYASSFIFALANLPGNVVSILYVEQIGRRQLLFYGMLLAGLSTIGFALGTSVPAVVITCATLFNAFSVAGW